MNTISLLALMTQASAQGNVVEDQTADKQCAINLSLAQCKSEASKRGKTFRQSGNWGNTVSPGCWISGTSVYFNTATYLTSNTGNSVPHYCVGNSLRSLATPTGGVCTSLKIPATEDGTYLATAEYNYHTQSDVSKDKLREMLCPRVFDTGRVAEDGSKILLDIWQAGDGRGIMGTVYAKRADCPFDRVDPETGANAADCSFAEPLNTLMCCDTYRPDWRTNLFPHYPPDAVLTEFETEKIRFEKWKDVTNRPGAPAYCNGETTKNGCEGTQVDGVFPWLDDPPYPASATNVAHTTVPQCTDTRRCSFVENDISPHGCCMLTEMSPDWEHLGGFRGYSFRQGAITIQDFKDLWSATPKEQQTGRAGGAFHDRPFCETFDPTITLSTSIEHCNQRGGQYCEGPPTMAPTLAPTLAPGETGIKESKKNGYCSNYAHAKKIPDSSLAACKALCLADARCNDGYFCGIKNCGGSGKDNVCNLFGEAGFGSTVTNCGAIVHSLWAHQMSFVKITKSVESDPKKYCTGTPIKAVRESGTVASVCEYHSKDYTGCVTRGCTWNGPISMKPKYSCVGQPASNYAFTGWSCNPLSPGAGVNGAVHGKSTCLKIGCTWQDPDSTAPTSSPTFDECNPKNCDEWDCDQWCVCYNSDHDATYERLGCAADDEETCRC